MIRVVNKKHGGTGVYIGRPSPLGNPFVIGRDGDRKTVVAKYRQWLVAQWFSKENNAAKTELQRLIDLYKTSNELHLVCWCAPQACHGDVIKQAIEHESI